MAVKGDSGEVLDGNEEHFIRNWRKGDSCATVAKNLAGLCVSWKENLLVMKWDSYLRFPEKGLKMWLASS